MRNLERKIAEKSPVASEIDPPIPLLGRIRLAVKKIITAIVQPVEMSEELFAALRGADINGKMEILDRLIDSRQGDLVMMCLQSFPEIDPNIVIRKLIAKDLSAAVILNQFRIKGLDKETSVMIDKEYYRIAPLIFPIR